MMDDKYYGEIEGEMIACPACPGTIGSTIQRAALDSFRSEGIYPESVTVRCPTCDTLISGTLKWKPVIVSVNALPGL